MSFQSLRKRGGFTLLELSMAMTIGMMIAAMVLAIFNQQLNFLRIYRAQSFLIEEAPIINTYVSKLVGKADRFRLHATVDDALNGTNSRLGDSPVVLLNYRQPDGTMRASILSFERGALYYYLVPADGTAPDEPEWYISNKPSNISFTMVSGVLQMTLTGPAGEVITYSGTMQQ